MTNWLSKFLVRQDTIDKKLEGSREATRKIMELTEQLHQRDKQLAQTVSRLNSILESQTDCIVRACPVSQRVSYANTAHVNTFYEDRSYVDKLLISYIHPDDHELFYEGWKRILAWPPHRMTVLLRCKTVERGYRWFEWQGAAIFEEATDDCCVTEVQAVGRDVHDQKSECLKRQIVSCCPVCGFEE